MRNLILPFLASLAIAVAALAVLRHDPPQAPTLPVARKPDVATSPQAGNMRHVRRLLYTRLGGPADLRIEGLRPSRVRQYGGVTCGRVAWNDIGGYKRFIAAKRNVLIDGQAPDFDTAWQRICNGSPTMGAPPQIPSTP